MSLRNKTITVIGTAVVDGLTVRSSMSGSYTATDLMSLDIRDLYTIGTNVSRLLKKEQEGDFMTEITGKFNTRQINRLKREKELLTYVSLFVLDKKEKSEKDSIKKAEYSKKRALLEDVLINRELIEVMELSSKEIKKELNKITKKESNLE